MFCRKCGNEIPEDSAFCPKCGMSVVTDNIEDTAVAERLAVTLEKTAETVSDLSKSMAEDLLRKRPKPKLILILAGALATILAIVLFAIILPERHPEFYYKRDEDHKYYIIQGAKKDMKEINIPDTIWFKPVRVIEDEAFRNSSAESVSFGKNIQEIGERSFESCTKLKSIKFCSTYDNSNIDTVSIGTGAFYNCSSLSDLTFPSVNTIVGDGAFCKCKSLKWISLDYVSEIGQIAFSESGIKSISLSCDVGLAAFSKCSNLENVYIYADATLSNNIFEGCTNLKEATVWALTIPPYTFSMCSSLEKVYWKNSNSPLAEIGDHAFVNCSFLSEIVTREDETLETLSDITNYNSQITIGEGTFDGCDNFNSYGGFNPNNMLIYTPEDFMGKNLYDVAEMLGAEYTVSGRNEYSSPGFPTFHILGKPFEYTLDEYYYNIMSVSFYNQNMWLSSNGSCTDNIHLGMDHDEILDILRANKKQGDTVSDSNDKINVYIGDTWKIYNIYFDEIGTAVHCEVMQDLP